MKTAIIGTEDYDFFSYPGGEIQVRVKKDVADQLVGVDYIKIVARITSSLDVMKLVMLSSAIEGLNPVPQEFILPYLPYARADRRFVVGDCFGLEAFGNIMASCGPQRVVTLDAHSKVSGLKVPDLEDVSSRSFIKQAIDQFAKSCGQKLGWNINILFPDKGAAERYKFGTANALYASKQREPVTGKFLGFSVPDVENDLPILIVDDLCDGGGTFIGIADELAKQGIGRERLGLYVTHGIFSKGIGPLASVFYRIYCTNSFMEIYEHPYAVGGDLLTVFDCLPELIDAPHSEE